MGKVQRGVSNDLQTGSEAQETEICQNGTGKNRGFPEHCVHCLVVDYAIIKDDFFSYLQDDAADEWVSNVNLSETTVNAIGRTGKPVRLSRQRKVIDYKRMSERLDFSEKHEKVQKSELTSRKKKISIPKSAATPKMSKKNGGATTTTAGTSSGTSINDTGTDDIGAGNVGASTMGADATGNNATER